MIDLRNSVFREPAPMNAALLTYALQIALLLFDHLSWRWLISSKPDIIFSSIILNASLVSVNKSLLHFEIVGDYYVQWNTFSFRLRAQWSKTQCLITSHTPCEILRVRGTAMCVFKFLHLILHRALNLLLANNTGFRWWFLTILASLRIQNSIAIWRSINAILFSATKSALSPIGPQVVLKIPSHGYSPVRSYDINECTVDDIRSSLASIKVIVNIFFNILILICFNVNYTSH